MPCTGTDPCDCDGDGDRSKSTACQPNGGDCDDHDKYVNSKVTAWIYDDAGPNNWDYNCSGAIEYEITEVLQCPMGAIACDTTTVKWHGSVPDCGQTGQIGTCTGTLTLCSEKITGTKRQGCH
jgi:hypothetical protein